MGNRRGSTSKTFQVFAGMLVHLGKTDPPLHFERPDLASSYPSVLFYSRVFFFSSFFTFSFQFHWHTMWMWMSNSIFLFSTKIILFYLLFIEYFRILLVSLYCRENKNQRFLLIKESSSPINVFDQILGFCFLQPN